MSDFIDIYCERTAPGFWDEPLNALTNAAFLLAAVAAFLCARRKDALTVEVVALLVLLVAIGFGSFAFHTLATGAAQLADTLPILLYQLVFIFAYGWKIIGLKPLKAAFLLALFFGLTALFGVLPQHWLNGSLSYGPAFFFLLGLGAYHYRRRKESPRLLLAAAALFAVSLTARSLDVALCPLLPGGIHFLWHLCNAGVLYLTLRAYIVNVVCRR